MPKTAVKVDTDRFGWTSFSVELRDGVTFACGHDENLLMETESTWKKENPATVEFQDIADTDGFRSDLAFSVELWEAQQLGRYIHDTQTNSQVYREWLGAGVAIRASCQEYPDGSYVHMEIRSYEDKKTYILTLDPLESAALATVLMGYRPSRHES